jgi:Lysylphosphatidylglycerol synthase TM region
MVTAPAEILRDRWLLLQTSVLQFALVALDAATLDVMLRAVGHALASAAVFASFTMRSLIAILGVIPGRLGLFEGGAVTMPRWFDVSVEAGLAATLLLCAWTFWLPMVPGMWITRHEERSREPWLPGGASPDEGYHLPLDRVPPWGTSCHSTRPSQMRRVRRPEVPYDT